MLSSDEVRSAVETLFDAHVMHATPTNRGYANENWHVVCADRELLVKVAPAGSHLGKAAAASRAVELAAEAGAPVPRELLFDPACAALGNRPVRVLEFVHGVHPESVLVTAGAIFTFFTSFGTAVAKLHSVACEGFSSRVGGALVAPTFPTWAEYVAYRVPQILGRALQTNLYSRTEWNEIFDQAMHLVERVSPVVEPRLTHRDLYLDNVLAGPDCRVAAIVDFDNAEPWDPAADWVKLRWQVFPRYPGAADAYRTGYHTAAGELPMLEERVRLADILELSNHAVGAQLVGSHEFALQSKRRLDAVLALS